MFGKSKLKKEIEYLNEEMDILKKQCNCDHKIMDRTLYRNQYRTSFSEECDACKMVIKDDFTYKKWLKRRVKVQKQRLKTCIDELKKINENK